MKSAIAGRTMCDRSWQQCPLSSQISVSTGPPASAAIRTLVGIKRRSCGERDPAAIEQFLRQGVPVALERMAKLGLLVS